MTTANNIIPIASRTIHGEPTKTVHARKLHEFLGVGRDYSNWIKSRINKYQFVKGEDYVTCSPKRATKNHGGHNAVDHYLTLDMAKELAMVENSEKGREARRYFIACEKQLRESAPTALPKSIFDFADEKAMLEAFRAYTASKENTLLEASKHTHLSEQEIIQNIDHDYVYGIHPVPEIMFRSMSAAMAIFNKGLEVA